MKEPAVVAKCRRAAELGPREAATRVAAKLRHRFGYAENVRRIAFWLDRYSRQMWDGPYVEREEAGPINLEVKLARVRSGGPFEPYDVTLINRAAVSLLQPRHRRILEVGSGTGAFASGASSDVSRRVVASEMNAAAREWAAANRSAPNIAYCARGLADFEDDSFDLAAAIEVVEHIADFGGFLRELSRVASEALITTPNKAGDAFQSVARTPPYSEHVREWSAGEFYWVLRAFFGRVELYTVPELPRQVALLKVDPDYIPRVTACTDMSAETALIALCGHPARPPTRKASAGDRRG
jgi:2-polyprenyl-3-methyl-5-hydroxy-6-metoxy-1,4-benzoquinol methylase